MSKYKYYSHTKIAKCNARYNLVIGERSNGKTYDMLNTGLKTYCETGRKMAYIRRWQEDFRGGRGSALFSAHITNGLVEKYTNGLWTDIYYYSRKWYLCRYEGEETKKRVICPEPFCYGFALTDTEHDKSTSYPDVDLIVFDEFLTRSAYLPNEFVLFCNTISTIIRLRDNVIIYMLGNTVNNYSPYFEEMGIDIKKLTPGSISVYSYGDSALKVAVEYCGEAESKQPKASDVYFAFNNPHLKMITAGQWEFDIYPHLPYKYNSRDVIYTFFIIFNNTTLQCEIIYKNTLFIYIHKKTTPLRHPENDVVFTPEYSPYPLWNRNILKPSNQYTTKIAKLFNPDIIFYQSNQIGEDVRNYLNWCKNAAGK